VYQEIEGLSEELGNALFHIIIVDESWVFHYNPTNNKAVNGKLTVV
jgi:hypothetical protein